MFRHFLPSLRNRENAPARREDDAVNLWDEFFRSPFSPAGVGGFAFPAVDVRDDEKEVVVTAELPGIEPKELDLYVENDSLVLKGEKKYERKDEKSGYSVRERVFGRFHRVVPLPVEVRADGVKAEFKNGVLTVHLPKDEARRPKRIEISG